MTVGVLVCAGCQGGAYSDLEYSADQRGARAADDARRDRYGRSNQYYGDEVDRDYANSDRGRQAVDDRVYAARGRRAGTWENREIGVDLLDQADRGLKKIQGIGVTGKSIADIDEYRAPQAYDRWGNPIFWGRD